MIPLSARCWLLPRLCAPLCLLLAAPPSLTAAQETATGSSVIDRLSGFDQERIEAVARWLQTPQDTDRLSEAAKLLFQVNRLARTSLAAPPSGSAPEDDPRLKLTAGDAVTIRGRAIALASAPLPADLAEVLELDRIYRVEVQTAYHRSGADEDTTAPQSLAGPTVYVLTTSIPSTWSTLWTQSQKLDQPTSATGVVVRADAEGRPRVLAAAGMAWFPTADSAATEDWALLAAQGFNVSLLEEVRALNRKPLLAADQTAFYPMLKATHDVASLNMPPAPEVDASELLRNAPAWVGRRLRLSCQSVRITRITINNPSIREALGANHYWQLDALGDLGNVVIRIENDEGSEPATFINRYPVSIVTLTLPDFLRDRIGAMASASGAQSDVLMLSRQLSIDGFFYRLWSYESDFMGRHGGGNQFGPLLMATQIVDIEPPLGDRLGVAKIGQGAAAVALAMLVATGIWMYVTARRDTAARQRSLGQGESLAWPTELDPAAIPPERRPSDADGA